MIVNHHPSNPTLSILIPRLPSRDSRPLLAELHRQAEPFGKLVEIIASEVDKPWTSGFKRNILTHMSTGDYIAFVDDDDFVSPDYVESLMAGCRCGTRPGVVSFSLDMSFGSAPPSEVWKFGLWPNHRDIGKMCVNHLCAWRRDLAMSVAWCNELGNSDDKLWFLPLFHSGRVTTEFHVDKILYHYRFDRSVTRNQTTESIIAARRYVGTGIRCFFNRAEVTECRESGRNPDIYIEVGGSNRQSDQSKTLVRDRLNRTGLVNLADYECFYTVRV